MRNRKIFNIQALYLCGLLLMQLLVSCIGTVDTAKEKKVKSPVVAKSNVSYGGVNSVRAIGHTKLEVKFEDSPIGDKAIYYIYVNYSPIPIQLAVVDTERRADGLVWFTLSDLLPNTTYSVQVHLYDLTNKEVIESKSSIAATTYSLGTAIFDGLNSVENRLGLDSVNSLILMWNPAENLSQLNEQATDTKKYAIVYTYGANATRDILNPIGSPNVYSFEINYYNGTVPYDEYTVTGLAPGTLYCFRLRAYAVSQVNAGPTDVFETEDNFEYRCASTAANVGPMVFDTGSVEANRASGPDGRNTISITWTLAEGGVYGYKVGLTKFLLGTTTPLNINSPDQFSNAQIDATINSSPTVYYWVVDSGNAIDTSSNYFEIDGLSEYTLYQLKFFACGDADCLTTSRQASALFNITTTPNFPAIPAISQVVDPFDKTNPELFRIDYEALFTASGFLTDLHVYCFSDDDGSDPVLLEYNDPVNSPGHPCHGIDRITPYPANYSGYDTLDTIVFESTIGPADGKEVCLGLVPQIVHANYTTNVNDFINGPLMNIKCKTLQLLTPSSEEFPGFTSNCGSGNINQNTLQVRWNDPTGGLYTHYQVVYLPKVTQSFSFSDAIAEVDAALTDPANDTGYHELTNYHVWTDIADGTQSQTIVDLIPGVTYQVGILTYLVSSNTRIYSEYNSGVVECQIPLPDAEFSHFQDLFAVGPKTNGLIPEHYLYTVNASDERQKKAHIFESLNQTTWQPYEVELAVNDIDPAGADVGLTGTNRFDGIYGANLGDPGDGLHIYSNQGIVTILFKDITLEGYDSQNAACAALEDNDDMNLFEASCAFGTQADEEDDTKKNDRLYGYKIYRSTDNKNTWVDLTSSDAINFQTSANSGLVRAREYTYYGWDNGVGAAKTYEAKTMHAVRFTDYSNQYIVEDSSNGNPVERGLEVWYKVIPYFNGQPMNYDSTSGTRYIERVILPPPNMAFVSRKIANKVMCEQIESLPNYTDASMYYSCPYNGLGASFLNNFTPGEGRYDIGSDLLVDRWEIGCDFTRGSIAENESTIHAGYGNPRGERFNGTNAIATSFVGCHATQHNHSTISWDSDPSAVYDQILRGDCLGRGVGSGITATVCADETLVSSTGTYRVPGLNQVFVCDTNDANDPHTLAEGVIMHNLAAAQPHAVYYYRDGGGNASMPDVPGKGGANLASSYTSSASRCQINLPRITDFGSGNRVVSRWFGLHQVLSSSGIGYQIAGISLDDIYNDTSLNMYDSGGSGTDALSPMDSGNLDIISGEPKYNYYIDRSVARVMTSNEARLPPIEQLSQGLSERLCNQYEVEVGHYNTSDTFVPRENSKAMKRIPSKKLSVAMSQWTETLSPPFEKASQAAMNEIENIENGTSHASHAENMSCNVDNKSIGGNNYDVGDYIQSNLAASGGNYVTSGSSITNSLNDQSTQNCTSRWGIQDLIGNYPYFVADQFFCNFTEEILLYGPPGDVNFNNGVELLNANSSSSGNNWYSTQSGPHSTRTAWVSSGNNTGECSAYMAGADRTGGVPFTSGGLVNPVFNFDGSLNTSLISINQTIDPAVIQEARDGFGVLFDTGQDGFSNPLAQNDTLSFDRTDNRYFNPVLGLAISGNLDTDTNYYNGAPPVVGQWFQIGLERFFANNLALTGTENDYAIARFPAGLSGFTSVGMSTTSTTTYNYVQTAPFRSDYTFLYDVDNTNGTPQTNVGITDNTYNFGANIPLARTYWNLHRQYPTTMLVGGDTNESAPGRYTARLLSTASGGGTPRCIYRVPNF